MRTLYDEDLTGLDISAELELAQFTVSGQHVALIVMINLDGLSGVGGEYSVKLLIDDRLVVPDRQVTVEAGQTSISIQSRDLVLYEDGVLKIKMLGLAGDTNLSGRLIVIDTSPVTVEEVSDLVESITPTIITSVEAAIAGLNVTVKPETKVLGPCRRPVVPMPAVKRC